MPRAEDFAGAWRREPTAAEYRREAAVRDRWLAARAGLMVAALACLVFWGVPPPAPTDQPGAPAAATNASPEAAPRPSAQRRSGAIAPDGHGPDPATRPGATVG